MTETLNVRTSTAADLTALDGLFARSYPRLLKADYPPSVLVTALPLISRAQPALLRSGTFYVVETGAGAVIGAGGWTKRRQPGVADIRHVVTDDRHLRRGVARRLFERIFSDARVEGVALLDCQSTRTAEPFYQAMGFTPLGRIDIELHPGIIFPAIQMQRRL